jgi:hypothetical protein
MVAMRIMVRKFLLFVLGIFGASVLWAAENGLVVAGFETGQIQKDGTAVDGLHVMAAPDPQTDRTIYATGYGGFGPSTNYDVRVVREALVKGETVLPRKGNYFMWHQIFRDKDYTEWNGNSGGDYPRTESGFGSENMVGFDVEYWLAFSIYTPSSWEKEKGVSHNGGGPMLLTAFTRGRASETVFNFQVRPKSGSSYDHWYLNYYANPNSVAEKGIHRTDLGSNKDDIGRWTDFVFRFRANPFSKDTNPAKEGIPGAADKLFRANKGILQVWKSVGTTEDVNGDRSMKLVFDIENAPVGNVPSQEDIIRLSFRVYKSAWKTMDSTVKGPIWLGFDEIRYGRENDGIGFSTVHPSGMECSVTVCSSEPRQRPMPPMLLSNP